MMIDVFFAIAMQAASAPSPQPSPTPGAQGTVSVRVGYDRNGRVNECTVLKSSGNAEIDLKTCEMARKNRSKGTLKLHD